MNLFWWLSLTFFLFVFVFQFYTINFTWVGLVHLIYLFSTTKVRNFRNNSYSFSNQIKPDEEKVELKETKSDKERVKSLNQIEPKRKNIRLMWVFGSLTDTIENRVIFFYNKLRAGRSFTCFSSKRKELFFLILYPIPFTGVKSMDEYTLHSFFFNKFYSSWHLRRIRHKKKFISS